MAPELWMILVIFGIVIIIGILRILLTPFEGWGKEICKLFMLDCMGDILVIIFEILASM